MTMRLQPSHQHDRPVERQNDIELGVALVLIGLLLVATTFLVPAMPV